ACSRVALRLPGLRVTRRLWFRPTHRRLRCASPVALRLPGLRVHHRLRAGSPGKAFTPQPGDTPG
ncbi:hypothetical protein, partial [Klebsiella sp. ME-303]|uniref:hypothetical protein n=1 Tax=Klebsiella sp. ME-303 TaxID=2600607 RepID=UPI0011B57279